MANLVYIEVPGQPGYRVRLFQKEERKKEKFRFSIVGPSSLILKGTRRNFLAECLKIRNRLAFPERQHFPSTQKIPNTRTLSSAQPATWYRLIKIRWPESGTG